MEETKARKMLQIWSETPNFYTADQAPVRPRITIDTRQLTRKYGLSMAIVCALLVYTLLLSWWITARTEKRVREEVTAEVTSQMRQGFQSYLDQMEREQKSASFMTGEASRDAAIDDLTDALAPFIAGYRMDGKVSSKGAHGIGWCALARLLSGNYGANITEVLAQPRQWEFYSPDHAVRNEDLEIAKEIAADFIAGRYPDGFTADLIYAERTNDGDVALRNEFKTGSNTTFWRYPG